MLKYFSKKPKSTNVRPLGYVNLVGAELNSTGTNSVTVDGKTFYTVILTEHGIAEPFILGFPKDHIAQNWRGTAVQAIRGKVHPPVYLDHGKKKGRSDSSSVANNLKETADYPAKTGSMKKKAVGKKKVLYRTWKDRFFKVSGLNLSASRERRSRL